MKLNQAAMGDRSFSRVPVMETPRSSFSRNHGVKTAFDAGLLIPVFVDEVLPGDTFNVDMTGFCRLATPLRPVMDNITMSTFFFFVPYRLVWDNWERFISQDNVTPILQPQVTAAAGGFGWNSVADYFGIPPNITGLAVSALPFRAYNLIWNTWFRDQNLQTGERLVRLTDTGDVPADFILMRRGKRHDYFTSSLPWPARGNSVSLPLGTTAPVVPTSTTATPQFKFAAGGGATSIVAISGNPAAQWSPGPGVAVTTAAMWHTPELQANLAAATAATINDIRRAFAVQRMYERDARGGTRYVELIRAHFGVTSPDFRQQRPEYLGGGTTPVLFSTVAQTAPVASPATTLGNLGAFGTATLNRHGFNASFTEHGCVIGLVCVDADLTYSQGVERFWSRRDRLDHYWPALAGLGEQAVLSREIFADGTANDTLVWGYQERYAEYRYKPSRLTSLMRPTHPTSLETWHLSEEFASRPLLNSAFIASDPPIDRVIAVPSEPHFIGDFWFRFRAARPMPLYGVPGGLDRL